MRGDADVSAPVEDRPAADRGGAMTAVRIYIAVVDLLLLAAIVATREAGLKEFVVVTFPLLYLILEMRDELRELERIRLKAAAPPAR
jgi:hypothetical protein